jgi:signal transduction histidine kinase
LKKSSGPTWYLVLIESFGSTNFFPYTSKRMSSQITTLYILRHIYGFFVLRFLGYSFDMALYLQLFSFFLTNYLLVLNLSQIDLWEKLIMNLNRSENILNSVAPVIIQMDENMNIVYMNQPFMNYTVEKSINRNISEFSFMDKCVTDELKMKGNVHKIWKSLLNDKLHHYSLVANSIKKTNESSEYFLVINDVTDSKNLEEQEMLKIKAITSLKAKTEFIASMSHEIRNPLQVISYCSEILSCSSLDFDLLKFVENIKRSTKLLTTIIGDILDMSKIEAGKMNLTIKKLNIKECIENSIEMNSKGATDKKLKVFNFLDYNLPRYFEGDESRLVQVMNNFIANAVKYTQSGFISIQTKLIQRETQKYFRFECRDSGIGIKSESIPVLFSPFEQFHEIHSNPST